jgi:hypothetical protein
MKIRTVLAVAATVASLALLAPAARTDSGGHLGQRAQECTTEYGFASLGQATHAYVAENGNFAGGIPWGLAHLC